ncbi:unnamed protein product [Symbiodinium sp. CCMP2592]|nr:unnamed protein product [Symbiodinium sp. CCMP2592]
MDAYAAVLDRRILRQFLPGEIRSIAVAEDARKHFELIKCRCVTRDFTVTSFVLDLTEAFSKETLSKAETLLASMQKFSGGSAGVMQTFRVFCSDGEPAEQACPQMLKGLSGFNLKASFRCNLHSAQRSLENILQGNPNITKLLDVLISKYSSSSRGGDPGGFARALKNSARLNKLFTDHCQQVDGIMRRAGTLSYAPQRFDTILEVCETLCVNMRAVVSCLQELVVRGDQHKAWAAGLLQQLSPDNMVLLSLVAELLRTAKKYIHAFDNLRKGPSSLARASHLLRGLKQECNQLFSFRQESGQFQEPLVLSRHYDAGMLSVLRRGYDFLSAEAIMHKNDLVYFKPGTDEATFRKSVAKTLGAIEVLSQDLILALEANHCTGIAAAFFPFDTESWMAECDDAALLGPYVSAKKLHAEILVQQYKIARPTMAVLRRQGVLDIAKAWGQTVKHWQSQLPVLAQAVSLFLVSFESTGEIEQDLSHLEMYSSGRSLMRCRLDGLPPHEFVVTVQESRERPATYALSADAAETQQLFVDMFGGGRGNVCKNGLPRRTIPKALCAPGEPGEAPVLQPGKESRASLKRKRESQVALLSPGEAPDMAALAAVAANAASDSKGEEHRSVRQAIERIQNQKRKRFLQLLDGAQCRKKYDQAVQKERVLRENLEKALKHKASDVYVATPMHVQEVLVVCNDGTDTSALTRWGLRVLLWTGAVEEYTTIPQVEAKNIVWFLPDIATECSFAMMPDSCEITPMHFASRALGGWLAGPDWMRTCHGRGQVVTPMLRLARGFDEILELYIHKSAGRTRDPVAEGIVRLMRASEPLPVSKQWSLHRKWKHVKGATACVLAVPGYIKNAQEEQNRKGSQGRVMDANGFLCLCTQWLH